MIRIALILLAVSAIVLSSLYTEEAKKAVSATKLLNKDKASASESQQRFYKWQDARGQWHVSDTAPKEREYETVLIDPTANSISGLKLSEEEQALKPSTSKSSNSSNPPVMANPMQAAELINKAKDVEKIMQERQRQLEQAL